MCGYLHKISSVVILLSFFPSSPQERKAAFSNRLNGVGVDTIEIITFYKSRGHFLNILGMSFPKVFTKFGFFGCAARSYSRVMNALYLTSIKHSSRRLI